MENKHGKGRKKIEMKLIQDERARMATFSKSKAGIFKKASELCTLTDTDMGVILFSPTGKPHSFGNPSINSVLNRFAEKDSNPNDRVSKIAKARRRETIQEFKKKQMELDKKLEVEKEKGKVLDQMEEQQKSKGGLFKPIDELSLEELEELTKKMKQLREQVMKHLDERMNEAASSSNCATTSTSRAIDLVTDGITNDMATPPSSG